MIMCFPPSRVTRKLSQKPELMAGQDDGGNPVISKAQKPAAKSKSRAKPAADSPRERENK
jgi:hypothetical protein